MSFEPEHLCRWTMPECYGGEIWPNFYSAGVGQSRDSDALERSNFRSMLKALGGESETVIVVREGHWAVGWVEWIAIHQDDECSLAIADDIVAALADYPVVNESDWSELEYEEACEFWERMSVRDRAEYCARAGLSKFAARRDYLPPDDNGSLYELLVAA